MNSGNAEPAEMEALFAAGYADRAVQRYYETGDAQQRILNEQIDEAYVRIRMGLPPRDQFERARYSEWAARVGMGVSPGALGPGGPERRAGFLAAAAKREEQFTASRAWARDVVGEPGPLLYPEDAAAQPRSHEAAARLEAQLPPRDNFECETYRQWAQADPGARRARETGVDREQEWHPSRWEIATLEETCGSGAGREADALDRIRTARGRDRDRDPGIEPPF